MICRKRAVSAPTCGVIRCRVASSTPGGQPMLNEQVSTFEQLAHLLLLPGGLAGGLGLARPCGVVRGCLGMRSRSFLRVAAKVQHRLNFLDDVELTDLMGHIGATTLSAARTAPSRQSRDAPDGQATHVQLGLEVGQQAADVVWGRVVLQDAKDRRMKSAGCRPARARR